jgi:hypothetical protein
MPCQVISPGIIVCSPPAWTYRAILRCPVCKRRRRHVVTLGGYYGSTIGCLGCGDSWMDGELAPRPWRRGWREESKARLRAKWASAMSKRDAYAAENDHLYGDLDDEDQP